MLLEVRSYYKYKLSCLGFWTTYKRKSSKAFSVFTKKWHWNPRIMKSIFPMCWIMLSWITVLIVRKRKSQCCGYKYDFVLIPSVWCRIDSDIPQQQTICLLGAQRKKGKLKELRKQRKKQSMMTDKTHCQGYEKG